MKQEKIPSLSDWGNLNELDYDAKYAFNIFYGKNIEQAVGLFQQNFFERAFELEYMPETVFNYYIFAFKQFLESNMVKEDDKPDAASVFINLIKRRVDTNLNSIKKIYPFLQDILYDIAFNQKKYDADIEIYGDFKEIYTEIKFKISNNL